MGFVLEKNFSEEDLERFMVLADSLGWYGGFVDCLMIDHERDVFVLCLQLGVPRFIERNFPGKYIFSVNGKAVKFQLSCIYERDLAGYMTALLFKDLVLVIPDGFGMEREEVVGLICEALYSFAVSFSNCEEIKINIK